MLNNISVNYFELKNPIKIDLNNLKKQASSYQKRNRDYSRHMDLILRQIKVHPIRIFI